MAEISKEIVDSVKTDELFAGLDVAMEKVLQMSPNLTLEAKNGRLEALGVLERKFIVIRTIIDEKGISRELADESSSQIIEFGAKLTAVGLAIDLSGVDMGNPAISYSRAVILSGGVISTIGLILKWNLNRNKNK